MKDTELGVEDNRNPHEVASDDKTPGAGVVVPIQVEKGAEVLRDDETYLLASKSFRGMMYTSGGNVGDDKRYSDVVEREFKEEHFTPLVEKMKADKQNGTKELDEQFKSWGLTDEQVGKLKGSLAKLSETETYQKLNEVVQSDQLEAKNPQPVTYTDKVGTDDDYKYKTYMTEPVKVEEKDLQKYLEAATEIGSTLGERFMPVKKDVMEKMGVTAEQEKADSKIRKDIKAAVDDTGLTDYTEFTELGLVRAAEAMNAMQLIAMGKEPDQIGETVSKIKEDDKGKKKQSIETTFINSSLEDVKGQKAFKANIESMNGDEKGIKDLFSFKTMAEQGRGMGVAVEI